LAPAGISVILPQKELLLGGKWLDAYLLQYVNLFPKYSAVMTVQLS